MAKLVRFNERMKEGEFLNKWFKNRVIESNKNVILAFTGPTGSGKTYNALSAGESWYQYRFHQPLPIENVCFNLGVLMKRLVSLYESGKIRKGEYFILEEAGANYGNLEFQHKISKMFSYILQSFRSMNVILILTVPVLNMINKNARQLVHAHFITSGINYEEKTGKVRPFFHQLSQHTGKSYWKYPRARVKKKIRKIQRLIFSIPPDDMLVDYEKEKARFVIELGREFVEEFNKIEREKMIKEARNGLTDIEMETFNLLEEGKNQKEVAEILGCNPPNVCFTVQRIKKKGYLVGKSLRKGDNSTPLLNSPAS